MEQRDIEREKLLEELAKLPQPEQQADNIDETVSCGYTPTPIPETHWSKDPQWIRLRASMTEPEPDPSGDATLEEPKATWYEHATVLAGCSSDEEIA